MRVILAIVAQRDVLFVGFALFIKTGPFYYNAEKATDVEIDAMEKIGVGN
jgi:hypothetical protein